jgi:hypothetical protein
MRPDDCCVLLLSRHHYSMGKNSAQYRYVTLDLWGSVAVVR